MKRRPRDLAARFLEKAAQDEAAVSALLDQPHVADEIVAFHAQQAVEKAIKAVLALHRVRFARTHNLGLLIDLLEEAGVERPEWLEEAKALTPFAVLYRYEDSPPLPEPVDRALA